MNNREVYEHEKFLRHLQEEKLRTQASRTTYVTRKLAYATGLLGLGSLNVGSADLTPLLYLVPFLALAFDLYILGEDYSVKRIGVFLGTASDDDLEKRWEGWVSRNRDPFAQFAMPLLTNVLAAVAALGLWRQPSAGHERIFIVWLVLAFLLPWGLFIYYGRLRKKVLKRTLDNDTTTPLLGLRLVVKKEDYVLTTKSYTAVKSLFLETTSSRDKQSYWEESSPEYGSGEYLHNVDSRGTEVLTPVGMVEDFRWTIKDYPNFALWFKELSTPKQSNPQEVTLLPARWLCHTAGFRHLSVNLFLEPQGDSDHMLVQVRGTKKAESPGLFDLPVAGHIGAEQTVREAVFLEAKEELGLVEADLINLTLIDSYEYTGSDIESGIWNVEFRWVFLACLSTRKIAQIRPVSDEVAAIALFSSSQIELMVDTFPDRVASGLLASMPIVKRANGIWKFFRRRKNRFVETSY